MTAVSLVGSVQFLIIGILGEYVGRIYEQVKGRPIFVIERVVRADRPPPRVGDEPARPGKASIDATAGYVAGGEGQEAIPGGGRYADRLHR
jgi:hypothetical protein